VSATATEPSGSAVTPSGCCSSASIRRAVGEAEVEEAAADAGADLVAADQRAAQPAQGRGAGVGDPQRAAVGGGREPGRLREPGLHRVAVDEALVAGAGEDPSVARAASTAGTNAQSWCAAAIATAT
jgi:hypothetical protein